VVAGSECTVIAGNLALKLAGGAPSSVIWYTAPPLLVFQVLQAGRLRVRD
jgi:hypothetical protein